jgi:hypothetical protein
VVVSFDNPSACVFAMPLFETDLLLELVDRKRQILAQLCQQGLRQLELIDRQELGELLQVLAVKQQLIAALDQTERELDPFRDQTPEERRWRTPAERARCAKLLADCEMLLAETLRQERASESQLRLRRDETANQLAMSQAAGMARHAYVAQEDVALRQLDLCSEN